VLKEGRGGGRGRYLYPVAGTLIRRHKIGDISCGDKGSHDVKRLGMVSVKTETGVATKKKRKEGQEEAIREAMAAVMEMDNNRALKVPSELREKKVKYRNRVRRGEKGFQNGEANFQEGIYVHNDCVAKESSGRNSANMVAVRGGSQVFLGRSKLERDRGGTSARNIIDRAEYLIADSFINVILFGSAVSSFFVAT